MLASMTSSSLSRFFESFNASNKSTQDIFFKNKSSSNRKMYFFKFIISSFKSMISSILSNPFISPRRGGFVFKTLHSLKSPIALFLLRI